mmetsp:Transcript_2124/g.7699  ORF Transcript_2124/g.7699 Transcript_2124/m.7699 type:complete len:106 (-) Transcript_2124:81-398(-)
MPSISSPTKSKYRMELECKKTIGSDSYAFYFPIEIGEFLVHSYAKNPDSKHRNFSVSVYESGNIVSPRQDQRFASKYWSRLTQGSLGSKDLYHLFQDLDSVAESH